MKRRVFLASPMLLVAGAARAVDYPRVIPGAGFTFPRDHGSHPAFRTEWWYVTGWVKDGSGNEFGIQVTFFRHRPGIAEDNPSAFAPRQLLFAHAALADSRHGRLRHDQRSARAGFGLAEAREETTDVRIGDWSLTQAEDAFVARIAAREFAFDLRFALTQALLPEGDGGYSRKGSDPRQASYYYSCPQLAVSGDLTIEGRKAAVAGTAWLDHEWSSEYMASDAVGWDWTGINLADGGALMAFQMRGRDGRPLWAGGTHRDAKGQTRTSRPTRSASSRSGGGARRARRSTSRSRWSSARAASSTRSRRSWMIRSSIPAPAPERSTGKARSARSKADARWARATWN